MGKESQKKAAFLVRCSTDKQDYERQLEDLYQVAERFGLSVSPENIYGEHITGKDDTTKKDRLSIIQCRNDAEVHKFDVLLVAEVSRMSRDSVSGRVYVRQFRNLQIPVYFRDKMKWTINPETMEVDESFERELGNYFDGAADYLKSMKTQIASGRRSRLRNNQLVIGHVPIGYKKRGGTDKKHKNELVVDEEVAPMVRDIFSMYIDEGGTMKTVALAISAKYGIRKTVSGIQQILARAEYYTGKYTVFMSDPDHRELKPEPFVLTFEPLIDQATFEAATSKRKQQRNSAEPYPQQQQTRPLTRLIKCPYCGHSFSPKARSGDKPGVKYRIINGQIAYSWLCMSRINNHNDCESHANLNDEKVETIIWEFIKKELLSFADINKDGREEKIDELKRRLREAENQIPLFQQAIDKTDLAIRRAYTAYMNAPEEVFETALTHYNSTLVQAKRDKDNYQAEIKRLSENIQMLKNTIEYYNQGGITHAYITSVESNSSEKRKIFTQLIEKICPYCISPGIFVLETYSINGIYYILFNGHSVGNKRIAYYIAEPFAEWHPEFGRQRTGKEQIGYFSVKNLDILECSVEFADPNHVAFQEMVELCRLNQLVLPFYQIYEQPLHKQRIRNNGRFSK